VAKTLLEIEGTVQGVGFRPFVYRLAVSLGVKGYVKNRGNYVEVLAECDERTLEEFVARIREEKPPLSRVERMSLKPLKKTEGQDLTDFRIAESDYAEKSDSVVPPDAAVCADCLRELREPGNRRNGYFFTTCTNCGPRFTIVRAPPFDRERTTMSPFDMCSSCESEYRDPMDRRYHAQTIACPGCGPEIFFTDGEKKKKGGKAIEGCADLIENGEIAAIKGYGGYHISCSASNDLAVRRLRRLFGRRYKPFAIMAKDVESVRSFAFLGDEEKRELVSYRRPIILLKRKGDIAPAISSQIAPAISSQIAPAISGQIAPAISGQIAPGLHNVGVMLPYSPLHHLLFDFLKTESIVMTSANESTFPIIKDDLLVSEQLMREGKVDGILFYDREISNRCDDSVVKYLGDDKRIIRRSRGYVPSPIEIARGKNSLALGGEENVSGCIMGTEKAFLTQHIGDCKNPETLDFLVEALGNLTTLTTIKDFGAVACDLHPRFWTTKLAERMAGERSLELFKVQHHYAHGLSLMAEHGCEELIAIVCDGFGYGTYGGAWGGEILYCKEDGFERLGHLQEHLMVGGDLATRYPMRMVASILYGSEEVKRYLSPEGFPYGEREIGVVLKQLERENGIKTTSCGRVLDAISALLGICYERTYEGEPAMRLEAVSMRGSDLGLEPKFRGDSLDTSYLLRWMASRLDDERREDLALTGELYLARGLAEIACEKARKEGVKEVGFSGGVAYNEPMSLAIKKVVKDRGLKFLANQRVPSGDGGLSFGQCYYAHLCS
jgi:hydrogenase maturation protein HypF